MERILRIVVVAKNAAAHAQDQRHEEPDPPGPAETYLAVTRRRYVVRHYELSRPAYQLLYALLSGESLGAGH